MKSHKGDFAIVESKIYDVAGGISMDEILDLQKKVKEDTGIKTSRVDWRTKTGIILWFCENWSRISPIIDKYRNTNEAEEHNEAKRDPEVHFDSFNNIFETQVIDFDNDLFNDTDMPTFFSDENNSSDVYENFFVI